MAYARVKVNLAIRSGVRSRISVAVLILTALSATPVTQVTCAERQSFNQPLNSSSLIVPDVLQDDPLKLFELGQEAHEKGDFNRALELYRAAIKLKPEFPESFFQIGNALVSLSRTSEAEDAYRHAIELRDDWVLPQIALGNLLVRLNRYTDAQELFNSALKKEPKNFAALGGLARLNLRSGKAGAAIEIFKRALDGTSDDSSDAQPVARTTYALLVDLARAEISVGDKAGALEALTRAVRIDPSDPEALIARAQLYLNQDDKEKALADLEIVRKSLGSNRNKELSLEMARLLARAGRSTDALGVLDSLDESAKNGSDVLALRADLSMSDSAEELSPDQIAVLEKLLQTNPRNAQL
ncbi:MAG: tetratricopeptide repeat protein, partial [Pyrinomonadaceae bacterium]